MPDPAKSLAQNRGRRAVQRKLYMEEEEEEEEDRELGKTVQAGNFVYIQSMRTKWVTDENFLYFSQKT